VEEALYAYSPIQECAVFGVPDRRSASQESGRKDIEKKNKTGLADKKADPGP
jgi:hypothetical protein